MEVGRLARGPPSESQEEARLGGKRRRLKPVSEPLAICSMVFLMLAATMSEEVEGAEAAQSFGYGDKKCHYYAGGEVYPGEASRVPVKDHSLHLSKAKSKCTKRPPRPMAERRGRGELELPESASALSFQSLNGRKTRRPRFLPFALAGTIPNCKLGFLSLLESVRKLERPSLSHNA
uniref:Uncharacterized protein n=1 Tax=Laticauda laticaudata TaxID=8630 RepID=A0A8C5WW38_LATLA